MVFLVITRRGYDELRQAVGAAPSPLWVGKDVLTGEEVSALRADGSDLTIFSYSFSPREPQAIEGALEMIGRHHSGETIWVERQVEPEYDASDINPSLGQHDD